MEVISKRDLDILKKSEEEIISEMDMMSYRLIAKEPDTDPKNDGDADDPNDENKLDLDNPEEFELVTADEDGLVIGSPEEVILGETEPVTEAVNKLLINYTDFLIKRPSVLELNRRNIKGIIDKRITNAKTIAELDSIIALCNKNIVGTNRLKNDKINNGNVIPVVDKKLKEDIIAKTLSDMETLKTEAESKKKELKLKGILDEATTSSKIKLNNLEKGDYTYKLDEFIAGKYNILYISGLSGSGKSSLAKEIKKTYHIDKIIKLDDFEHGIECDCPFVKEYMKLHPELLPYFEIHWSEGDFIKAFTDFFNWLTNKLQDGKRYIVEGVQIFYLDMKETFNNEQPFVIKMADYKTAHKRALSDKTRLQYDSPQQSLEKIKEMQILRDDWVKNHKKHLNKLNEVNESFNKLKSAPDFEHNLDNWKAKKTRFLFITGISGSGKSTQAKTLAKDYNANLVELDSAVEEDFVNTIGETEINKMNDDQYASAVTKYVMGLHKTGQVIIEGVGFLEWFNHVPSLKNHAFIIKGTSHVQSTIRAAKRDEKTAVNTVKDMFKHNEAHTYYLSRINKLKKSLGEIDIKETQFIDPFLLNTLYATNTISEPIEKEEELEDLGMFDNPEEELEVIEDDLELSDIGKKLELVTDNISEALTTKQRARLKDDQFGIPSLRKYPIHDEKHIRSAETYFNKVDKKHEKELAHNIIAAAKRLDVELNPSDNNKLKKYLNESIMNLITEVGQFKAAIGQPYIRNVSTVNINDKKFVPFYIVLTSNDTQIAKAIKFVTKEPYNHASFATDPSLKTLYSFARKPDGNGGFVIESTKQGRLYELMHADKPTEYAMFVTFISTEKFEKIKTRLNNMIDNIDAYKYKIMQLIRLPLGIKNNDSNAMICSEFVGTMLKEADDSLVIKHPSLLTPYQLINPKFHFISSGLLKEYKVAFTKKRVAEILKSENIAQFITENVSIVSKLLYDSSLNLLNPNTQKVFNSFFPFIDIYPENLFSMTIGGLGLNMPFTEETDFDDLLLQYNSSANKFASIEDEEHNRFALYIQNIYYSLFIRTELNLLNNVDLDTLSVIDTWLDRVKLYYSQMLQSGLSPEDVNMYKQKLLDIMWYYKEDPHSTEVVEFRKIKLAAKLGLTASAINDSHIEYDEIFRNYIDISNIQDDVFLTMDKRYPVFSSYDVMRSAAYFAYLEDFDKDYFVEKWCKKYLFYGCKFKLTNDMQITDYVKAILPDIIDDDVEALNSSPISEISLEGVSAGNVVVSLDDDGNLLIKKKLDADLQTVYRRTLRNIKIYKDSNNIEALKYEVALLDYMAQLIEVSYITPKINKVFKNDKEYAEKRKEMLDLRAIIINSYSQSLKFVLDKEPTFNYREYYNTTPFSKDIKLTKNELLTTVRLTKEIIKLITGL